MTSKCDLLDWQIYLWLLHDFKVRPTGLADSFMAVARLQSATYRIGRFIYGCCKTSKCDLLDWQIHLWLLQDFKVRPTGLADSFMAVARLQSATCLIGRSIYGCCRLQSVICLIGRSIYGCCRTSKCDLLDWQIYLWLFHDFKVRPA